MFCMKADFAAENLASGLTGASVTEICFLCITGLIMSKFSVTEWQLTHSLNMMKFLLIT